MRKLIILIGIMICIPLLVSGCTKTDYVTKTSEFNQSSENEQTVNLPKEEQQPADSSKEDLQPSDVPKENTQEVMTEVPSEQFEVDKSDTISDWNELKAKVYLYSLEITSEGMSWSKLSDYKMTTFSLDFPDNWEFNGSSVFNDQDNKVAEIVPIAEATITIDDLFQNYQPSVVAGEELISKELFAVNGCQGLRIVSKNQIPFWYPHKYYISNGSYIIGMMFYSSEINESDQQLFEKIISTFRFEEIKQLPL